MKPCGTCGNYHAIYEDCPKSKPKKKDAPTIIDEQGKFLSPPPEKSPPPETKHLNEVDDFAQKQREASRKWKVDNQEKYRQYMRDYMRERRQGIKRRTSND